jgi:SAM-dependent methyltransferase
MRRDERAFDPTEGHAEIAAIESQWTRIWEAQGGPKDRAEQVKRREEFQIMWPYIQQMPKGSRLLDGGCGLGDWVAWFTRAGYPTLGLDISAATISQLQKLHANMEFAVGDIRATGLPAESFDGYFSWGTFEHFEEGFGPVVTEAFRVLKPGGQLFISVPFVNMRHALAATLLEPWRRAPETEAQRFYQWRLTRAELAHILARHGFKVDDVRMINKRSGLQRWLNGTFSLNVNSKLTKGIAVLLYPFVPKVMTAHMILAIAQKPR